MEKKSMLVLGLAALLLTGVVFAVDFGGWGKRGIGCSSVGNITGELGLSGDASPQEIREALFQRRLVELGLTEDSTIRELRSALKEQRQGMIRERLGLSEDAGEEEIQAALAEKAGDKPLRHMGRMGGRGLLGL